MPPERASRTASSSRVSRPRRGSAAARGPQVGVDRRCGLLDSLYALSPEDPRWIRRNLVQQLAEAWSRRQRLVLVPPKIAVLAVQSPQPLTANVLELRDWYLPPLVRRPKRRPLLE